jgi:hypothetical protein
LGKKEYEAKKGQPGFGKPLYFRDFQLDMRFVKVMMMTKPKPMIVLLPLDQVLDPVQRKKLVFCGKTVWAVV